MKPLRRVTPYPLQATDRTTPSRWSGADTWMERISRRMTAPCVRGCCCTSVRVTTTASAATSSSPVLVSATSDRMHAVAVFGSRAAHRPSARIVATTVRRSMSRRYTCT